jgi:3-methyl-2-oxobutanoate hydroxymethyltransferase
LLEGITESVANSITQAVAIPTIGIGASPACDGQVLVAEDMLGLSPRAPKFAKPYADLRSRIDAAVSDYAQEVRAGTFPELKHCFGVKKVNY